MTTTCSSCGGEIEFGAFPFCGGDPSKHEPCSGGFILGNAKKAPETVIFRDRKGNILVPGDCRDPTPAGCLREEVTGIHGVRKLQKQLDQQSRDKHEQSREAIEPYQEFRRQQRHSALRQKMQQMSPAGRDFARAAIERANQAPKKRYDPGNHVGAYEHNNPSYNSERTGWKEVH